MEKVEENRRKLAEQYSGDATVERWDEELEQLAGKLRGLRERSAQRNGAVQFMSELEQKDLEIKALEEELRGRDRIIKDLEDAGKHLEREKNKLVRGFEGEIGRLKRDIEDLENRLKEREEVIKLLKKDVSELEKGLNAAGKDLKKESERIKALEGELRKKEASIERLEKDHSRLEDEKKTLLAEVREKTGEVEGLKKKLESWHASIGKELDSAIEFISEQANEIERLKAELAAKDERLQGREGLLS